MKPFLFSYALDEGDCYLAAVDVAVPVDKVGFDELSVVVGDCRAVSDVYYGFYPFVVSECGVGGVYSGWGQDSVFGWGDVGCRES